MPLNQQEFTVCQFNSHDGSGKTTIELGMHVFDDKGITTLSLYCPFWMINKTGLLLSYRVSAFFVCVRNECKTHFTRFYRSLKKQNTPEVQRYLVLTKTFVWFAIFELICAALRYLTKTLIGFLTCFHHEVVTDSFSFVFSCAQEKNGMTATKFNLFIIQFFLML